jgi:ABC-type Zn2+ transport system substrate-binding protein/surface adhesin
MILTMRMRMRMMMMVMVQSDRLHHHQQQHRHHHHHHHHHADNDHDDDVRAWCRASAVDRVGLLRDLMVEAVLPAGSARRVLRIDPTGTGDAHRLCE